MTSCNLDKRPYRRTIFALLALALLLAAACGDADEEEGPGFLPGGSIDYPTGAGDVILRIEERDVFSRLGDATEVPLLTLYGDGTLIVLDRQADATATGLSELDRYKLSDEGISYMLGRAQLAGLYGGDTRYAGPYQDVPVTHFTVTTSQATSVTRVDGLHITDPEDIPANEREDRERLSELVALAHSLDGQLTDEHLAEPAAAFDATRLQIVSLSDDTPAQPSDPVWPLATPLMELREGGSQFGGGEEMRCFELAGEDAEQFISELDSLGASGRAGMTWQSDDQRFDLYVRPLLPDQSACS